jgi:hypothetical protein
MTASQVFHSTLGAVSVVGPALVTAYPSLAPYVTPVMVAAAALLARQAVSAGAVAPAAPVSVSKPAAAPPVTP